MKIRKGYIIDGYQLEELVGAGGFSSVYKARSIVPEPLYETLVAIKILHPRRLERGQVNQFVREARTSMTLEHENVVTVHNLRKQDGNYFIIMELLNTDVAKAIRDGHRKFTTGDVENIVKNTSRGLAYIHSNGIIHKDINPSNILISFDLQKIKLTDFGLSEKKRLFGRIKSTGGTEGYLPPEIQKRQRLTKKSDIYSFGKTIEKIYLQLDMEMPLHIEKVVDLALVKNPEDRIPDMETFLSMLNNDY